MSFLGKSLYFSLQELLNFLVILVWMRWYEGNYDIIVIMVVWYFYCYLGVLNVDVLDVYQFIILLL